MRARRSFITAAAASLALVAGACGGNEREDGATPSDDPVRVTAGDPLSLTQVEAALEREGIDVMRTGDGAAAAETLDATLVEDTRYVIDGSPEFDVLVFPSTAAAREARGALERTGEAVVIGGNVAAVLPERPSKRPAFALVERTLERLSGRLEKASSGPHRKTLADAEAALRRAGVKFGERGKPALTTPGWQRARSYRAGDGTDFQIAEYRDASDALRARPSARDGDGARTVVYLGDNLLMLVERRDDAPTPEVLGTALEDLTDDGS